MIPFPTKARARELAGDVGKLFSRLWKLAETQEGHAKALKKQAVEILALTDQVRVLQAREEVLLARAAQAAAEAVNDLARRIGHLEGSGRQSARR